MMDIIVTGRRVNISDSTRDLVTRKLTDSILKFKERVIRTEVEFMQSEHRGDLETTIRCEITVRSKGPVVRASATAEDKIVAFDRALDRLVAQLRKAADRRKPQRGGQRLADLPVAIEEPGEEKLETESTHHEVAGISVDGEGPLVVREKTFETTSLTLAQALDEMELVGHDFYLFVDATTGLPSVVYRRRAYDYGVIHLDVK